MTFRLCLVPLMLALLTAGCNSRSRLRAVDVASTAHTQRAQSVGATPTESAAYDEEEVEDEAEDEGEDFLPQELPPRPYEMTLAFCQEWNPEYKYRGRRCCAQPNSRGMRRVRACAPERRHRSFCAEATEAQLQFSDRDLEALSVRELEQQAFCAPGAGFLARAVPLLETPRNRIRISNPSRCANFGTTGLVMLFDRVGKRVRQHFKYDSKFDGVRLVVGDMSAPRGGCLATPRGAHSGHTNGLDADLAFLEARPGRESNYHFRRDMDVPLNWWFLKAIIEESPVCVQYIFLDRQHIRSLKKFAARDPLWDEIKGVFKHVAGHKNHYHIRVGTTPRNGEAFDCRKMARALQ